MKLNTTILHARRLLTSVLVTILMLAMLAPAVTVEANAAFREIIIGHKDATFKYELFLTDQNGAEVTNPRKMSAGDVLNVEIRLTRNDYNKSNYDSYGIEFRLLTRGLNYNNDGKTLRSSTQVHLSTYMDGDAVGFAWYDMTRQGESFANPVLTGSWSYTVEDPAKVNITVPVALIYVVGEDDEFVPVGTARLFLDLNGGELIGEDVSGEYPSGKAVVLPDAKFADYAFEGWSDGVRVYPAGTEYVLTGIVTLTAQWANLVRDHYVQFIFDDAELVGDDLSGFYAYGETIILPDAIRDGYVLSGWSDGTNVYPPGSKYVVTNTVNLTAVWEDDGTQGVGTVVMVGLLIGLLLIGLFILLLWKRSFVKYSLVNGDLALSYRNGSEPVRLTVVLVDGETEHQLGESGMIGAKDTVRFIRNELGLPVAPVETGKYEGKLLISDGSDVKVKKCRIKVVDRELD